MKKMTWQTKILFKALEKTRFGSIQVRVEGLGDYIFGEGLFICDLWIRDQDVIASLMRKGDIAFAEAIIEDRMRVSDLPRFVQWACQNDDQLKKAFHGTLLGTVLPRFQSLLRRNSVTGAQKNIMAHYDLGNDFYQQWLDPSMSYSSAVFDDKNSAVTLEDAQMVKYDRILEVLDIRPGDRVLEIGCGWGGFFSRAIEKTGCHVTAVMNSPAQAEYNRGLIAKNSLQQNVDLVLTDYRFIQGKFDKIVSIEMIEAVGEAYWPTYFAKVASSLKAGGQALIQSITIREDRFQEYRRSPDFINSMIFPGGMLLTNTAIETQAKSQGMLSAAPFEFGLSYAETLKRWREKFQAGVQRGEFPKFDERFFRLWDLYLGYCEGAFLAGRINVGHFALGGGK